MSESSGASEDVDTFEVLPRNRLGVISIAESGTWEEEHNTIQHNKDVVTPITLANLMRNPVKKYASVPCS